MRVIGYMSDTCDMKVAEDTAWAVLGVLFV